MQISADFQKRLELGVIPDLLIKSKIMCRAVFTCLLFALQIGFYSQSQPSIQTQVSNYSYYPPSKDKESCQRLNLLLSSTYIIVAKEAQIDFDTCLSIARSSLGLSRLAVLGEGIDDPEGDHQLYHTTTFNAATLC